MGKKFCFVVSPIGDADSQDRRRADGVLDEIIRPALEDDYDVERADHDKTPGIVTDAIIGSLIEADLVVADLTDLNPNVMYELAIRHATAKPVIQMMEVGGKLPFDIQVQNTVFFRVDLAGRSGAIHSLQAAEKAIIDNPNMGNPIRRAAQFRALQASGDSSDRTIGDALQAIFQEIALFRAELTPRQSGIRVVGGVTAKVMRAETNDEKEKGILKRLIDDKRLKAAGIETLSVHIDGEMLRVTGVYRGRAYEVSFAFGPSESIQDLAAVAAKMLSEDPRAS